mgnify:CR=1 FL=1
MCMPRDRLQHWLGGLSNSNAQGEYYLTDCPGILKQEGKPVEAAAVSALEPEPSMFTAVVEGGARCESGYSCRLLLL